MGVEQSKLMVTAAEAIVAEIVSAKAEADRSVRVAHGVFAASAARFADGRQPAAAAL